MSKPNGHAYWQADERLIEAALTVPVESDLRATKAPLDFSQPPPDFHSPFA
jgi:hypothetical protein